MRVAVLNDIHANLPALEAILPQVRDAAVDGVILGGDVLPGPMQRETFERVRELDVPVHALYGNGELAMLAQLDAASPDSVTYWGTTGGAPLPERYREWIRSAARDLSPEDVRWVRTWPKTIRLAIDGIGDVLFCHGTPTSETDAFTALTPEDVLKPVFDGVAVRLVVCGHTHMQFDRTVAGRVRLVNAGSVGMPYGDPLACWLLLGPSVELRRTPYDLEAAAARIRATAYPGADDFAERGVLRPPAEREMLELFTRT